MAKGHAHYRALLHGPHTRKINNKWYTLPPKLLRNFYVIFIINRCGCRRRKNGLVGHRDPRQSRT